MSYFRALSAILVATVLLIPAGGFADGVVQLSPEKEKVLRGIERYLDAITTLEARFVQVSSNGDQAEGLLKLSRPGNLRIDYDPPLPVVIIANNEYISYFDKELKQATHIDIDNTPLGVLLADKFKFAGGRVTLTGFEQGAGVVRVSMVKTNDPFAGRLTLVFSDRPFDLRKWTIVDAQGVITDVTLTEKSQGGEIPSGIFQYSLPTDPDDSR